MIGMRCFMFQYQRKKEIIKNTVYIFFILLLAVISTYYIYHNFQEDHSIDFNSDSLDVTYHDSKGDKISIKKITPVTDSVGLSSKSYTFSIKNNLTERVGFQIKIMDDLEEMELDECMDYQIPKEDIRISIKENKGSTYIFDLSELENGILYDEEMEALETKHFSVRIWIRQDSALPRSAPMHYHGKIQVMEENQSLALNRK